MISKISYIKLIREDIRHRGWLAALSGVLLFLSMPVYTLIYLDSYSEDPEVLKEFADTFSGFINGYNSAFLIILIGILAFAVGISGFHSSCIKKKNLIFTTDLRSNVISCSQSLIWQDCSSFSSHI